MKRTGKELQRMQTGKRLRTGLSLGLMAWIMLAALGTERVQAQMQTQVSFTTAGNGYTLSAPGGVTVVAEMWGGGGGGGASRLVGANAGGGGGGGYIKNSFTSNAGLYFSMDVGAGGAGGTGPSGAVNPGSTGGASEIRSGTAIYTALGGRGGAGQMGIGSGNGGAGGTTTVPASGAVERINGTAGSSGSNGSNGGGTAYSGNGSSYGYGGNGGRSSAVGQLGSPGTAGAILLSITYPSSIVITSSSTMICSGSSATLSVQTPHGVTYQWYRGSTSIGTGNSISVTEPGSYRAEGSYQISHTVSPGGTPLQMVPVTVSSNTITLTAGPVMQFTPFSLTGCSGDAFSVTPVSGQNGNNFPSGTTYSWTVNSNTGGVTGATGGSSSAGVISLGTLNNPTNTTRTVVYNVVPTGGGCTGSAFTVSVDVKPVPQISNISRATCSGQNLTVTPQNSTNGVVPSGTTYSWTVATANSNVGGAQSGTSGATSSINLGILTNSAATAQTVVYQVTPISGGCQGSPFQLTVSVSPAPIISDFAITVCSGTNVTVTPTGIIPPGTNYLWFLDSNTGVIGGNTHVSSTSIVLGTLTNNTSERQTMVYDVEPFISGGGCTGNNFKLTVHVDPYPDINPIAITACNGENAFYAPVDGTDGTVPVGTTYSWVLTGGANGVTGASNAGSGAQINLGLLNNTSGAPATVTYDVTPDFGGCTGNTFTLTVTLNPSPQVLLIADEHTYCVGESVTLTANVTPAGTYLYDWYRDNVLIVTGGGNTHISTGLPARTTSYQYRVEVRSAGGCGEAVSNTVALTVTNPQTVVATLNYANICESGTIRATANIAQPENYTFAWSLNSGSVVGREQLLTLSRLSKGNHTLRVTATPVAPCPGCETVSASAAFTVHSDPVIKIKAENTVICAGSSAFLQVDSIILNTDVNSKSNYTMQWAVNGTAIIGATLETFDQTAVNTGTFRFSVRMVSTNDVGCVSEWSSPVTVTVREAPTVLLVSDNPAYFGDGSVRLTANVTPAGTYVYDWYRDNVRIVSGGSNTHVSSGLASRATGYVYHVVARPASGCEGRSNDVTVTVGNLQTTSITLDRTRVCAGGSVTAMLNISSPELYTFKWYLNGDLRGYEQQFTMYDLPGGVYTLYVETESIIPCSDCKVAGATLTFTVPEVEVPALFIAGCESDNTNPYRTAHIPIKARIDSPQAYTITFTDMARSSFNHTGTVRSAVSGDMYIEARLPLQAGDYEVTIEIDGCLYPSTGRVLADAHALDGARLIEQRWNDVLTVNNNPATNGGFTFYAYQWYKDNSLIPGATEQYYTEPDGRLNGSYHVELRGYAISSTGHATDVEMMSCPFKPLPLLRMAVSPVPVKVNEAFVFTTSLTEAELIGATLDIYDAMGQLHRRVTNLSPQMTIEGFAIKGFYFGRLTTRDSVARDIKIVVL